MAAAQIAELMSSDDQKLMEACSTGDLNMVKNLLSKGKLGIRDKSDNNSTLLHKAAYGAHCDVVTYLLQCGIAVDEKSESGFTSLHIACQNGHVEVARILKKHGADINACTNDYATPLHRAVFQAKIVPESKRTETVEYLIACGAEIDARIVNLRTPLHFASRHGHLGAVKLLMHAKAQVNAEDQQKETPLHLVAEHICTTDPCQEPGPRNEIAKYLLQFSADIEARDERGWTPLHFACFFGHPELVDLFLKHKADVSAVTTMKETPLHLATASMKFKHRRSEIVENLLKFGADIQARDMEGWSPLHFACFHSHLDLVNLLLKHKADVSTVTNAKDTSLHLTVKSKAFPSVKREIAELLLRQGICVNVRNAVQATALHIASSFGMTDVVCLLISYGADPNITDSSQQTPLHCVAREGKIHIYKALLEHGGDPTIKDKNGKTAPELAEADIAPILRDLWLQYWRMKCRMTTESALTTEPDTSTRFDMTTGPDVTAGRDMKGKPCAGTNKEENISEARTEEYKYDAFVSHNHQEDYEWVENTLVPQLEDERHLKLCVGQRDFIPGWPIIENIVTAVQNSRHTIIVLTPAFLTSLWCETELHLALARGLHHPVVVILDESILTDANLSEAIRLVLKTFTYLKYSNNLEAQGCFWQYLYRAVSQ